MSTATGSSHQILDPVWADGPVTHSRLLTSRLLHVAMCCLGILPWLLHGSAALQAFGWGMWLPGAGFISAGGLATLLFPLTLLLFGLAFVAWFGTGMIIAPLIVWGGSALLAAAIAPPTPAAFAPLAVPALTAGILGYAALRRHRRIGVMQARRAQREAALPAALTLVRSVAEAAPPLSDRELSPGDLSLLRYVFDRALQPVGQLNGFDRIDQFQTSALRYQLNQAGWALAVAQRHHFPNFHGYASEGQRRVIEQYLQDPVWGYWRLENAWGNFSLDGNPARKDNIMLTGYISINALLYMNNTGDRRYAEHGSMSFVRKGRVAYAHDAHSINQSLLENFDGRYRQAFCLYPCEPNWIYPACNFRGLTGIRLYDTVFGTQHFAALRERFRDNLEREFIRPDGSIVPLRSKLTGHELPFPAPEAVIVKMLSPLFPDLAERYWAIVRHEGVYHDGGTLQLRVPDKALDFGNYKSGNIFVFDGYVGAATEMGDRAVVEAGKRMIADGGKMIERGGVRHFNGSNMANLSLTESWLGVSNGWRDAILTRPADAILAGPVLAEATYPDVLVAYALSDGEDLSLVLYPGRTAGKNRIGLGRLKPGSAYRFVETGERLVADASGNALVEVVIDGRTPLHLVPT